MKIRADIVRTYLTVHTWVGIVSGLVLFIAFFAGAINMFKAPINQWSTPPSSLQTSIETEQLQFLVDEVLAQYPAARTGFKLQFDPSAAPISWAEDNRRSKTIQLTETRWQANINTAVTAIANESVTEALSEAKNKAESDNHSIEVVKVKPSVLGGLIDMLHQTAGIPSKVGGEYLGVWVTGSAAMLYFLALVSGLIILLPTLAKNFLRLRTQKSKRRFWLDAHNIIGVTSLPFHLVICITAIGFAFHDQFYGGLSWAAYGDKPLFGRAPLVIGGVPALSTLLPVSDITERVHQVAPGFHIAELAYMNLNSPRPMVLVSLESPAHMVRGAHAAFMGLNPFTGELNASSVIPGKADPWNAVVGKLFSLHFGSFGGNVTRWLYFTLGLAGAFLFFSGNVLWLEKRRKKLAEVPFGDSEPKGVRFLSALTSGVCLGSVTGVGACLAASKWLQLYSQEVGYGYLWVYYVVFLAVNAWAFLVGGRKASYQLMLLASVVWLAVPATSSLAFLWPELSLWVHINLSSLAVDAFALLASVFLLYAGYRLRSKILHAARPVRVI